MLNSAVLCNLIFTTITPDLVLIGARDPLGNVCDRPLRLADGPLLELAVSRPRTSEVLVKTFPADLTGDIAIFSEPRIFDDEELLCPTMHYEYAPDVFSPLLASKELIEGAFEPSARLTLLADGRVLDTIKLPDDDGPRTLPLSFQRIEFTPDTNGKRAHIYWETVASIPALGRSSGRSQEMLLCRNRRTLKLRKYREFDGELLPAWASSGCYFSQVSANAHCGGGRTAQAASSLEECAHACSLMNLQPEGAGCRSFSWQSAAKNCFFEDPLQGTSESNPPHCPNSKSAAPGTDLYWLDFCPPVIQNSTTGTNSFCREPWNNDPEVFRNMPSRPKPKDILNGANPGAEGFFDFPYELASWQPKFPQTIDSQEMQTVFEPFVAVQSDNWEYKSWNALEKVVIPDIGEIALGGNVGMPDRFDETLAWTDGYGFELRFAPGIPLGAYDFTVSYWFDDNFDGRWGLPLPRKMHQACGWREACKVQRCVNGDGSRCFVSWHWKNQHGITNKPLGQPMNMDWDGGGWDMEDSRLSSSKIKSVWPVSERIAMRLGIHFDNRILPLKHDPPGTTSKYFLTREEYRVPFEGEDLNYVQNPGSVENMGKMSFDWDFDNSDGFQASPGMERRENPLTKYAITYPLIDWLEDIPLFASRSQLLTVPPVNILGSDTLPLGDEALHPVTGQPRMFAEQCPDGVSPSPAGEGCTAGCWKPYKSVPYPSTFDPIGTV